MEGRVPRRCRARAGPGAAGAARRGAGWAAWSWAGGRAASWAAAPPTDAPWAAGHASGELRAGMMQTVETVRSFRHINTS